ncbi:MAG: hypothetical protein AAGD38_06105 [Acidobacteriota bacterium]
MSDERFKQLPVYHRATVGSSDATVSEPPYTFTGVTMRVLPLWASIQQLNRFVDARFNVVPKTIAHFEAAMPIVFLVVLDYGKMSSDMVNVGWVGQHEVGFMIPMLQYHYDENGQKIFDRWAYSMPYIFVDEAESMITGREIYGWGKLLCRYKNGVSPWAFEVEKPETVLDLEVLSFPNTYTAERIGWRSLLRIVRNPAAAAIRWPPRPNGVLDPFSMVARTAHNAFHLADESVTLLTKGFARDRRSWGPLGSQVVDFLSVTWPYTGLFGREGDSALWPIINLKQFREASGDRFACYQSLNSSNLVVEQCSEIGLYNALHLLGGDYSGGYQIEISESAAYPIVSNLGLYAEYVEEPPGSERRGLTWGRPTNTRLEHADRYEHANRIYVAKLTPVFPMWLELNLSYERGQNLAWRAPGYDWSTTLEPGEPTLHVAHHRPSSAEATAADPTSADTSNGAEAATDEADDGTRSILDGYRDIRGELEYNYGVGGALPPYSSSLHMPVASTRFIVLPVADQKALGTFIDNYLNAPLRSPQAQAARARIGDDSPEVGYRLRTFGGQAFVVLTISSYLEMYTPTNNVGSWIEHDVSFMVPMWRTVNGVDTDDDNVFCRAWHFLDRSSAVISFREVLGEPALLAEIELPRSDWLAPSYPDSPQPLVRLSANVFPALFVGQKASPRTLFEVVKLSHKATATPEMSARAVEGLQAIIKEVKGQSAIPKRAVDELERMAEQATEPAMLSKLLPKVTFMIDLARSDPKVPAKLADRLVDLVGAVESEHSLAAGLPGDGDDDDIDVGFAGHIEAWLRSRRFFELVNLKHYHHADEPDRACYQAWVSQHIRSEYEIEPLMLDVSRLRLRLHRFVSQPIAEVLGLEVAETEFEKSKDPGLAWEGMPVDVVKPLFAFLVSASYTQDCSWERPIFPWVAPRDGWPEPMTRPSTDESPDDSAAASSSEGTSDDG